MSKMTGFIIEECFLVSGFSLKRHNILHSKRSHTIESQNITMLELVH